MSFTKEFVVNEVRVHSEIHGFTNAIALIIAHWRITHSDYPNGVAYHFFRKYFHHDLYTLETFTPVEDVTDAMMEQWLTADMTPESIIEIENRAMDVIKQKDAEAGLQVYYTAADS